MEVFIIKNDEQQFLENLLIFKANIFIKQLSSLKVSDEVKIKILKEAIRIIEEDYDFI